MKTVLLPVGLRLNERQAFGDSMHGARGIRKSLEQILLAQRHRGVRGVGAGAADANHFLDAVPAGRFHQLGRHHHVVVESFRHVAMCRGVIHGGGEMQQQMRPVFIEELLDVIPTTEVAGSAARNSNVRAAALAQFADDRAAQESCAARDHDAPAVEDADGRVAIIQSPHSPPRIAILRST